MRNFTIYLAGLLCLFVTGMNAQESFESRAKAIANKIEQITKEEKEALKSEVALINEKLDNGEISLEDADEQKLAFAEQRARNIETRTAGAQEQLRILVQEKVDGKIMESDSANYNEVSFVGFKFRSGKTNKREKDTARGESRTTSQFVFAAGFNNLSTNNSVAHSDYKIWGSYFYEYGLTYNTRLFKNSNLLHAKYGLSLMYNDLRPTENRILVEDGNQTNLVESDIHLDDARFRNVHLVIPVHLEFDFSGNKKRNGGFQTHQSFRFGIGGYAGANLKSKQILHFEDNGNDVKQKTKGGYNVNDFIYGVSTYIGYKETSLYVKYDINPLFENNAIDQRNISLGLRFDLN